MSHYKNGFVNLGNTCYLNACLQLIFNIPELQDYFIQKKYTQELNQNIKDNILNKKDIIYVQQFVSLISDYYKVNNKLLTTKNLLQSIIQMNAEFRLHEQHDSQEMLIFILDNLHEALKYEVEIDFEGNPQNEIDTLVIESIQELSKILNKKYSIINELFYGMYYSQFISNENDTKGKLISKKYDHFNNLTLQFEGNDLYENLDLFFKDEIMDSKIKDENTHKKYTVSKITKIVNAPKYLFITLKKYDTHRKKNNNQYHFPIENLDFKKYCFGYDSYECNYELTGVILHSGSIDFGHYISVIKKGNGWILCNDDNVSKFNMELGKKHIFKNAYVLMYLKKEKK